ncbi:hypothetical protein HN51_008111 [Arachis hypogaea]|uniref:TPX2 central domain-containing protein n=2 Tax=Arachis TaxID=3817 RepID=A0A445D4S0_ARAHY|nr:uncharacterized protein LOC107489687 isoform X1 [Arachis duranensis]XP_025700401.1 uncharacterized protein LOC112801713 [Arachis hypogaea]XP_025700402.1 uncharacterized protein LOC112801713 [Arachis hypogaea]RYR58226.1 hypothetical protein Ahy_A05g023885 isoform A [Arachis hypogaea]
MMEEEFEEFEEIEVEYACLEEDEIDPVYEFDAPQFCDFLRPETLFDDAEAEQWFETAQSHEPSPFLLKFKWRNPCADVSKAPANNGKETRPTCSNSSGSSKSKVSSFMKPTASNLAKQKNVTEVTCNQSCRIKSQDSSPNDSLLSKRQKLEAGYIKKAAHLKHQALFAHKKTEKDPSGVSAASRPKATIPKEPVLETAVRAQRHKQITDAESRENTKSSLIARPLNKKILQAPAQSVQNKKTQRAKEANGEGVLNRSSNTNTREHRRTNSSDGSRQEKCGMTNKPRGKPEDAQRSNKGERGVFRSIKVYPLEPNDKRLNYEPPTDLLSKLSLVSDVKKPAKLPSKGLKENRPGSLHQEYEYKKPAKEATCGKQYRCVLITQQAYMVELGH